jgi:Na+-transporting NADH:ubiquinone oxidoreductase subunit NqrC
MSDTVFLVVSVSILTSIIVVAIVQTLNFLRQKNEERKAEHEKTLIEATELIRDAMEDIATTLLSYTDKDLPPNSFKKSPRAIAEALDQYGFFNDMRSTSLLFIFLQQLNSIWRDSIKENKKRDAILDEIIKKHLHETEPQQEKQEDEEQEEEENTDPNKRRIFGDEDEKETDLIEEEDIDTAGKVSYCSLKNHE